MLVFIPLPDLPESFQYPREFVRTVELGLINFEPWLILTGEALFEKYIGLRQRYPGKGYVPFASKQDNDDVVCWTSGPTVLTVHDYASSGWESRGRGYDDFNSWLRAAVEEYIFWGEMEKEHEQ